MSRKSDVDGGFVEGKMTELSRMRRPRAKRSGGPVVNCIRFRKGHPGIREEGIAETTTRPQRARSQASRREYKMKKVSSKTRNRCFHPYFNLHASRTTRGSLISKQNKDATFISAFFWWKTDER